jgi:GAF domain-containing protein/two-component sensor histidine kinase
MVKQVSHLLYVGRGGERRARLSAMLAYDLSSSPAAQLSLALLPELAQHTDFTGDLPQADLYLLDITEMTKEEMLGFLAQLKQQTPQIPLLLLATAEQEALAAEATARGADYYLLWNQFDAAVLCHVIRLLLQQSGRRRHHIPMGEKQQYQLIDSLRQAGATLEESPDADTILEHFLVQLEHIIAYDTASIILINEDIASVVQIRTSPSHRHQIEGNLSLSFVISQTPNLRQMAATKLPVFIPDVYEYEGWITRPESEHIRSWMGAPIIVRDRFAAVLDVARSKPYFYTVQDLHYLTVFAEQAALMLHNTQLYEETRRQFEQLKVLHAVALLGTQANHEDELIERTTQIIGEALYPDNFGLLLLDEKEKKLIVHSSYRRLNWSLKRQEVPIEEGIVGYVARTKRPYRTGDVTNDPYYIQAENETHSQLAVPLLLNDRVLGVISTESREAYAFSERDEQLLLTLASQLATAIEKSRLLMAERARRQEAETLRQAAATLTSTLDIHQVLDRILVQLKKVVAYDSASVLLLQDERLYLQAGQGLPLELIGQDFSANNELFAEIRQSKRPLYLIDVREYGRFEGWGGITHTRGWLGVPLLSRGSVLGLLAIDSRQVDAYNQQDIALTRSLADQAAIALENAQLYESTRNSAQELSLVTEVLRILNATPIFEEAFPSVYTILKQITGAQAVCLAILDREGRWGCSVMHSEQTMDDITATKVNLTHFAGFEKLLAGQPYMANDLSQSGKNIGEGKFYEDGYLSLSMTPLMGKRLLGAIGLLWPYKNGVNKKQLPLLNQVANATALAIERSRLFSETNRQADQLKLLNELGRQLGEQIDIPALCRLVVDCLHQGFAFTNAAVFLLDESNEYVVLEAAAGVNAEFVAPDEQRQVLGQGFIGQVAYSGERLLVNDTRTHPDFLHTTHRRVLSQLALPLQSSERILGVINVNSDQANAFTDNDVAMLTLVADQLAVTLEKARLFGETHRRTAELELIGEISTLLRRSNSVEEMLSLILDHCLKIVDGQQGSIFLVDSNTGDLVARWCLPTVPTLMARRYKPDQGITGYVATTGEIYITNNLHNDPLAHFAPEELPFIADLQGLMGLPLRTQERVVGVILLSLKQRHTYTQAEVRLLKAISDIAGSALDRAMVLETLEQRVASRTRELAEANTQLKALDILKSKFISDMSHELRTPVTNLGLYMDLLKQGRPEKHAYYLDVLRQQIGRLTHLVSDILSLSRLEMSRGRISFTLVDMNRLVKQTVDSFQLRIDEAELQLTCVLEADLPPVSGEPNQLAQIVSNLLSNALNYTPSGNEVTVQTSRQKSDGVWGICLTVIDTGSGIAEEEKELIFQRFYRGELVGQSNVPGTGLGLAIVQEVVSLHGGHVEVESELNKGSTFRVWLPAVDETTVPNGVYHEQAQSLV